MSLHPPIDAESRAAAPDHQEFRPYVPDSDDLTELSWSAVLLGAILGIVFGASSLYLVLRVGMTVSASIPVAVLSITIFRALSRAFGIQRATILENNIVQTTGSAGESIAFGVGVTMPALMILGYDMDLLRVMLVATLGGLLGILMMIPLRRAFIVQQHGTLTYPEGTACAEVLIVGEQGGASAKTVFAGFGIAFAYKVAMQAAKLWAEAPARAIRGFKGAVVAGEVAPELLGVGYIIGPQIASTMVAGGLLAALVLTPALVFFGEGLATPLFPGTKLIAQMTPDEIQHDYILYIGAGAVAAGGIISLFQALPLIISSIWAGVRDLRGTGQATAASRTDRDLPLALVAGGAIALVAAIAASHLIPTGPMGRIAGAVMIVLFGFLFVTVSSRLTGEIGSSSNPISGMTVATLLLTCLVFVLLGWVGPEYRLAALSIAGVVCIAASNGGTTSQDLKTGYLVGATPRHQQVAILVGALTSALVIGFTLLWLNDAATVVTKQQQYLPRGIQADPAALRETATGPDGRTYKVWRVGNETAGVQPGKYLVDGTGRAIYLIDPAINGRVTKDDNGVEVTKYRAPKATLMALIIDGILKQRLPWTLVLLGVFIAVVMQLCGVSALAFAVGVYLPLSTSMPIFIGGLARAAVDRIKRAPAEASDASPAVLLSSGYIAGGAIAGILVALLAIARKQSTWWATALDAIDVSRRYPAWSESPWPSLVAFGALTVVLLLVGTGTLMGGDAPAAAREGLTGRDETG
jgi:putative OPT family oligopeptide transporter